MKLVVAMLFSLLLIGFVQAELIHTEDFEDQNYLDSFYSTNTNTDCSSSDGSGYDSLSINQQATRDGSYALRYDACPLTADPLSGAVGCNNVRLNIGNITSYIIEQGTQLPIEGFLHDSNQLYIRYWAKLAEDFDPEFNTMRYLNIGIFLSGSKGYTDFTSQANSPFASPIDSMHWNSFTPQAANNPLLPEFIRDGQWHKYEFFVNYDNISTNGMVRMWVDDALILDWTGLGNMMTTGLPETLKLFFFTSYYDSCTNSLVQIDDIEIWNELPSLSLCPNGAINSLCECGGSTREAVGYCAGNGAIWSPTATPSCVPTGDEICDNGIDDDCNGLTDGADITCPETGVSCEYADIRITANKNYVLYFNGEYIGHDNDSTSIESYTVPLRGGENVIAVNPFSADGIVPYFRAEVDYCGNSLISDNTWLSTGTKPLGWKDRGHDTSTWTSASIISSSILPSIGFSYSPSTIYSTHSTTEYEVGWLRKSFDVTSSAPCTLTSASWDGITTVRRVPEGTPTTLVVTGNGCDGQLANFILYDVDSGSPSDLITPTIPPPSVTFIGGQAISNWVTEYFEDADGGDNYVDYIFNATVNGQIILVSAASRLEVSQVQTCTDNDGDGYNQLATGCGEPDCDDTNPDKWHLYNLFNDFDDDNYGSTATTLCWGNRDLTYLGYINANLLSETGGDCDDTNNQIYPGAPDLCNGNTLDDCNTNTPDGSGELFYELVELSCSDDNDNDCDSLTDNDDSDCILPCSDADGDGYTSEEIASCDLNTLLGYGDCDDTDNQIRPGRTELCNGIDDNCASGTDETFPTLGQSCSSTPNNCGDVTTGGSFVCAASQTAVECNVLPPADGVMLTWYRDFDTDSYGNAASSTQSCTQPVGYMADNTDCNDNNINVNPAEDEMCNTIDDDCDAGTPDGVDESYYIALELQAFCFDNIDNDCNGLKDSADPNCLPACTDGDGDGYTAQTIGTCDLLTLTGFGDCSDGNPNRYPGATEICNGVDDNCVGGVDETFPEIGNSCTSNPNNCGTTASGSFVCTLDYLDIQCSALPPADGVLLTWYRDADGDFYGNNAMTQSACTQPVGFVADNTDCNDNNPNLNPGKPDLCNGIDDDCSASSVDGSGEDFYQVLELLCADLEDNDCNGDIDAADANCQLLNDCFDASDCNDGLACTTNNCIDIASTFTCVFDSSSCSMCGQGLVVENCLCGGAVKTSGYCCNNVHSTTPCPVTGVVIVDNAQPGTAQSGTWTRSTALSGFYNVNYTQSTQIGAWFTWTANLPLGNYRVSTWYVQAPGRPLVSYDITHFEGQTTVSGIDQKTQGSQWVELGIYKFNGVSSVRLNNNLASTSGASADAIKFELVTCPLGDFDCSLSLNLNDFQFLEMHYNGPEDDDLTGDNQLTFNDLLLFGRYILNPIVG